MKSKNFLWISFPLFLLLTIAFLLPVSPQDYWWYLRLGGEISQTHAVPVIETFSQTQFGQPMVYHSWLSALLFFWVYTLGGISLTLLLRGILLAFTYALLWKILRMRGASPQFASLILFFSILAGSINWAIRPQLLVYPLFMATIWILLTWEETRNARVLSLLAPIGILWTNLHGSFPLLFLLGGAALLFGRCAAQKTAFFCLQEKKVLALALFAALLATLLNPRGFGAWIYLKDSLTLVSNQAYSREWMPPLNEGWQMKLFFGWIVFYLAAASLTLRALRLLTAVWLTGFGWLAFSGLRYGIWFIFILSLATAELLSDRIQSRSRRGFPVLNYAIGVLLLLLPLAFLPSVRNLWWADAPAALSAETPVDAAAWLAEHPELPAPLWADLAYSSYLVYALPERPVWIDTRFEVYPPEHWERYKAISAGAWNWAELLDAERINLLMLSKSEQAELLLAVNKSENWHEVYSNERSIIFVRQ